MPLLHTDRTRLEQSYRTLVNKGVELLDSYFGSRSTWLNEIDRDQLDMTDTKTCVLGQLFGDYFIGVNKLYESMDPYTPRMRASDYGFNANAWIDTDLEILRQLWLEVLDKSYQP